MSVSFGGLGIMTLRKPLGDWVGFVYAKGDLRSLFCIVVCSIVFLVLAHLTNPSENSFRAYLTEQSFRHHLSRLDDTSDDQDTRDKLGSSHRRGSPQSSSTVPFDHGSPFHFANRASVSLRTPKHVFHSFGIFTIAAIIPARADRAALRRRDRDSTIVTDSWFIGAFGKWVRGGVLDAWYQDVVARSNDEESWTSGILGMKALDKLNEYDGLPFSTKNLPATRSPPKLRNRDKSSQRLPARSSTPPPLPKSASLPLHTPRPSSQTTDRANAQTHSPQATLTTDQIRLGSPVLSRSPSTLFDQSPRIAEVLHQISLSKTSVLELRSQLADFQVTASSSHASLQGEVDSFRDRKRQEDASRSELKSRTKALDDSKRAAESIKRDAEKRLKAAQNTRDEANQRMAHLDKEIGTLQQRLTDDQAFVLLSQQVVSQPEQQITGALECKKQEIKVTEDVVAALNHRARELEDRLAGERDRLKRLRERAELRRQDRSFHPQHTATAPWTIISRNFYDSSASVAEPSDASVGRGRRSSDPHGLPTSPRPAKLALGGISNFNNGSALGNLINPAPRSNGYSIFDEFLNQPTQQVSGNFSPFGEPDSRAHLPDVMSPTSQLLIPSGLISSLDSADGSSRSFQSDSDAFMDREWREASLQRARPRNLQASDSQSSPSFGPVTSSPTSLHGPSANDYERDPFEVCAITSPHGRETRTASESPMDMQRVSLTHRTHSDPTSGKEDDHAPLVATDRAVSRRWFVSNKDKPKKGLNPDAKVFSLPKKVVIPATSPRPSTYDALNPNGLGPNIMAAPASANHSLLRAFAPSRAEREALHRALGGSTNTSLERLPSLSDMGSMPSSPALAHTVPAVQRTIDSKGLPSWLSALPRIRKPNFSPWDDEEPASSSSADKNDEGL